MLTGSEADMLRKAASGGEEEREGGLRPPSPTLPADMLRKAASGGKEEERQAHMLTGSIAELLRKAASNDDESLRG